MSEAPILKDTVRSSGRDALQKNIQAALALSEAIRSTLGPNGLDKLLIDDDGRTLVTNDGVTVLETAKVEHPVAKMMIGASSVQDKIAKDGTTSTVILAGEMLRNAWQLILQGIHPSTISRGYRNAEQFILNNLSDISFHANEDICETVIKTTLAGKGHSSMQEKVAQISLAATKIVFDEKNKLVDSEKIKLISQTGGRVEQSYVIQGLMLPKKRISSDMKREVLDGKIILLDGGLEQRSMSNDLKLNVNNLGVLDSFREKQRDLLLDQVDVLANNAVNVLACREGIDDDVCNYLSEKGIQAFRRVSKNDLNLLTKACNAELVGSISNLKKKNLGGFTISKNVKLDGKDFWVLEGNGNAATIVAKGSTVDVVSEVERCFDDALGVSEQLLEGGLVLCGGGASYVSLARKLRRYAETIPGREQLAIEAYADAIEVIIRVLAENAGIDPIASLLNVVANQTNTNSDNIGINLSSGKPDDMLKLGVIEPQSVVKQALIGATEVAISILRIDDVLWAKHSGEITDLPEPQT